MGRATRDGLRALRLRLESAWSQGVPRAPQPRCDDEGCAAGLAPRALLFAARSPIARGKWLRSRKKTLVDHISGSWMLGLCQPVIDVVLGAGVFEGVRRNEFSSLQGGLDVRPAELVLPGV